jgi:hypothetical protein
MKAPADMAERHGRILTELADLGLELARDLQVRARAASSETAAGDLARAFHNVARSVRQTLALEARLERDRKLAAREAAQEAARERIDRVQKRRGQVRDAVARLIWTEYEGEEAEDLADEAESLAFALSYEDDFLEAPIEASIARIREALGLSAEPSPTGDAPEDVIRASSG